MVPWKEYIDNHEKNLSEVKAYYSGFNELDSFVEGFQSEELITISGNTSQGKTLFLKSLLKKFAQLEIPVAPFIFEDPVYRFMFPFRKIEGCHGIFVPNEMISGNLKWIEEKVTEAKLKYGVKIVLIDHLHYIVDMLMKNNFSLNIGASMRFLKERIAIGLGQIVFLVCHQEKVGDDEEPSLNKIRDSSFIGQESDMVFIINRIPDKSHRLVVDGYKDKRVKLSREELTYDMGYTSVKIEKARRSGCFKKSVTLQKKGDWLEEL